MDEKVRKSLAVTPPHSNRKQPQRGRQNYNVFGNNHQATPERVTQALFNLSGTVGNFKITQLLTGYASDPNTRRYLQSPRNTKFNVFLFRTEDTQKQSVGNMTNDCVLNWTL